ncbi:MAG: sigma-70 family RNA polymerase sigma factor [candidate division WOR-3 bacterium]
MNKEKEFEIIYKKFSKDVYSYLLFLSLSREEAEDILQDVFIKFWKLFDRLKNLENIKAYLLKMARNRLIDLKRKEKKLKFVELNEEIFDFKCEDPVDKIKKIEFVKKILENLEEEEREIIILRFYENLKFKEISEILSINENTLRVKYLRILEKIRKYVYNYNYEK